MKPEELITYCGLYGGHCARWYEYPHFRELAKTLAEWIDAQGCGYWMPSYVKEFDYNQFRKGLAFFAEEANWYTCTKCCRGGDSYPECPIRTCCIERGEWLCFECAEFPCDKCEGFYDIRARGAEYVRLGREAWLAQQLELVRQGYELHTRKRYCSPIVNRAAVDEP